LAFSRALPLALIALAACGPIAATTVIDDAEVALARAHATDGEKYAMYETTLADLYLVKAKEAQGHARYATAQELATDALKMAEAATRKAAEGRTSGTPPPLPQAKIKRSGEPAPAPPKPAAEPAAPAPPPAAEPAPPPKKP
jgi:hypothetical protein